MVCFGGAFVFLALAVFSQSLIFLSTVESWGYLLVLSIFSTVLPILLMLVGLKHVSSVRASIISVLEPLVTLFVGILLLNETISITQIYGVLLLIGSTLLVQFQKEL